MQEGMQTGAYDAQFVHNGLLQIVVDAGVVPALLIVITFIIGFFDKKVINDLLEDHYSNKKNNGRKIYNIYVFLIWYKKFFVELS